MKIKFLLIWFVVLGLVFTVPDIYASEQKNEDLFDLSIEELINVEITTAGKKKEKIKDIPASVYIISKEEIQSYGYKTLAEVLENIPGLFMIDDYDGHGEKFGIRGFWTGLGNQQIIFMVNGIKQISDYGNSNSIPEINVPVSAIKQIEVIRGPMSAIYGNGAFFGAINIITHQLEYQKNNTEISSTYGTANFADFNINRSGIVNDKIQYDLNLGVYYTDGIDVPYSKLREGVFPPIWGIDAGDRTQKMLTKKRFYIDFSVFLDQLSIFYNSVETNDRHMFSIPPPDQSDGCDLQMTRNQLRLVYCLEHDENLKSKFNFDLFDRIYDVHFTFIHSDFYGKQYIKSRGFDFDYNLVRTGEKLNFIFGLYSRNVLDIVGNFNIPSFMNPAMENSEDELYKDYLQNLAVYFQFNWHITDKLKLTSGARLDYLFPYQIRSRQLYFNDSTHSVVYNRNFQAKYDNDALNLIPRIALTYDINRASTIKLLYGEAINRPSFTQNNRNLISGVDFQLESEKIKTYEVNLISNLSQNLLLSFSLFRNDFDNLVTRIISIAPDGSDYDTYSANAGKMITNGMEIILTLRHFHHFSFEMSATFQDTDDQTRGMEEVTPAYSPEYLGYLKIRYQPWKNLTMSLTGRYVDEMETYWDNSPDLLSVLSGDEIGRIGATTTDYSTLSFNLLLRDLLYEGCFCNLNIKNIFDTEIYYPTYTNNPWATKGTMGMGRQFYIGMGYRF